VEAVVEEEFFADLPVEDQLAFLNRAYDDLEEQRDGRSAALIQAVARWVTLVLAPLAYWYMLRVLSPDFAIPLGGIWRFAAIVSGLATLGFVLKFVALGLESKADKQRLTEFDWLKWALHEQLGSKG